jgi:hypothetical protein
MNDATLGRHCHDPHGTWENFYMSRTYGLIGLPGEMIEPKDESRVLFREMRCEACEQSLREYFYYECNKGCIR